MCMLCKEIALEALKPVYFWTRFFETQEDHKKEVLKVVSETSPEYQTSLAKQALRQS